MNYQNQNKQLLVIGILVICTILFTFSCKKLIQISPNQPNQIVTAQVFGDSTDATAAVVNIYIVLNVPYLGIPSGGMTVYPGLSADELAYTSADNTLQTQCYKDVIAPSYDNGAIWEGFYSQLYPINACIAGVSASNTISLSLKNQLIGECEVVRAFYYFNLVNLFGGVPLVTTTNYQVNSTLPRSPMSTVYTQIISDLKDAQKRLINAYPSAGRVRPNRYTATALLAKAYLYTGQWSLADSAASAIINSGIYSLEPNLNNVFLDGSHEAIWQVVGVGTVQNAPTTDGSIFVPSSNIVVPLYTITNSQLAAFEPGDLRMTQWLNYNVVGGRNYYYPFKYKNANPSGNPTNEDYMIFRLAEQYLIRAEAEANLSQNAAAIADINIVRLRAGLSPTTKVNSGSSLSDMTVEIMHERQTELFCEWGNRWYDLKRTNTIQSVLAAEKKGPWLQDNHAALYPIPSSEILLDPKLTQNPGY